MDNMRRSNALKNEITDVTTNKNHIRNKIKGNLAAGNIRYYGHHTFNIPV